MTLIVQNTDINLTSSTDIFGNSGSASVSASNNDEVVVTPGTFLSTEGNILDFNNVAIFDFTMLGSSYSTSDVMRLDFNTGTTSDFEMDYRIDIGLGASMISRTGIGFVGVLSLAAGVVDPGSLVEFTNAGTLGSTSGDGIRFQSIDTVTFSNTGSMSSVSDHAISMRNVTNAYVINTGTITFLETTANSPNHAALAFESNPNTVHVLNSGTITALEVAYGSSATGSEYLGNSGTIMGDIIMSSATSVISELINSGEIIGDIDTRDGDDMIVNTGEINGSVEMGLNNDTLENAGLITGDVDLGSGGDTYLAVGGGTVGGTISGGSGNDTITGGTQADNVSGGSNDDLIRGRAGDDTIDGGSGNDTLRTGQGDDEILGGDGDDFIRAGAGDDIITGGQGSDTIFGGTGADTFVFENTSDSPDDNTLRDIIQDFTSSEDVIDLSAFSGLSYAGNTGFSGTGPSFYATDANAIGRVKIFVDVNGDGIADMKIVLNNTTDLTEDDFLF